MVKIFFIFIMLFILTKSSTIKKYNADDLIDGILIELKDRAACICHSMDKMGFVKKKFYIGIKSNDKNAKIDKTLYYKFMESCDSKDTCDDIYLNNFIENNDRYMEIESVAGFKYEYEFINEDENQKALLIYYKDFTGEKVIIEYANRFFTIFIIGLFVFFITVADILLMLIK